MSSYLTSIAIVDDDEIFQMLIKKILEKTIAADSILPFLNGFAALSYFRNNRNSTDRLPAVILVDLSMPGMDGWEFLKEFDKLQFSEHYEPSVIIISGSAAIEFERLRAYRIIKGYLIKPIIPAKLIDMIQSAVQSRKSK